MGIINIWTVNRSCTYLATVRQPIKWCFLNAEKEIMVFYFR